MSNPTAPSTTIPGTTTLGAIRAKVRRLTLSPSDAQLTTAQLDEYINTYVVYDFPETLRTFNLKTTFEKKLATKSQNILRSTSLKKEKIIKAKAKGSRNFPKTY